SAPSGVSRSDGAIRSGSVALRRLSEHAVPAKASRTMLGPSSIARARATPRMFSVCIYEFSEPEVEANRVVGRNTERLELLAWRVGGSAALARQTIDLRIDATVLGPQVQVARGEVERSRTRAEIPARPALRQI